MLSNQGRERLPLLHHSHILSTFLSSFPPSSLFLSFFFALCHSILTFLSRCYLWTTLFLFHAIILISSREILWRIWVEQLYAKRRNGIDFPAILWTLVFLVNFPWPSHPAKFCSAPQEWKHSFFARERKSSNWLESTL